MMHMKRSDIAILNVKGSHYRCIINLISQNEAINFNIMLNADLPKKWKHNYKKLFSSI